MFDSFLTGSRAYGEPADDSDVDMVVYAHDKLLAETLEMYCDSCITVGTVASYGGGCFYFGNLNVVLVDTRRAWLAWKAATEQRKLHSDSLPRSLTVDIMKKHLAYSWVFNLLYLVEAKITLWARK